MNAEIRKFRDTLVAITNVSLLPMEVKRMVFAEVLNAVTAESDKIIQQEMQEINQKENEENE